MRMWLCGLTDRNADSLLLARKPTISHSNWINHPAPCIGATRRFGSLQINEVKDQTTQRLRVFEHLLRALLAVNLSQPLLTSPNLQRRTRDRTNLADTRSPVARSINQATTLQSRLPNGRIRPTYLSSTATSAPPAGRAGSNPFFEIVCIHCRLLSARERCTGWCFGRFADQGAGGAPKKPTTRLIRPSGAKS